MSTITYICRRLEVCILTVKIRNRYRAIENIRENLIERNHKHHNGRMEVDDMLKDMTKEKKEEIFNLKRKIIEKK